MRLDDVEKAHHVMFGDEGLQAYRFQLKLCAQLGVTPVSKVLILPIGAMSAYNKFAGWFNQSNNEIIVMPGQDDRLEDLLVHEICHVLQHHLELSGKAKRGDATRGSHRGTSWWMAVSIMNNTLYGKPIPDKLFPKKKSVRVGSSVQKVMPQGVISEVDFTHYPYSSFWAAWRGAKAQ